MSADLGHVTSWLFDLDNTLYPLESGLAAQISDRITAYVERLTGLGQDEAWTLQKRYLVEYGLTLRGLMLHHGVDAYEYHAMFADLSLAALKHDPALVAGIGRLPGRRLVFTNADAGHAARILDRLGLSSLFDDVFPIERAGFIPKPHPEAFARLMSACQVRPRETCFFDDAAHNLAPAAAFGMTTVLVGASARPEEGRRHIDHLAPDLAAFLATAKVGELA
jgi:putative hydrolase of the HAD superfamily